MERRKPEDRRTEGEVRASPGDDEREREGGKESEKERGNGEGCERANGLCLQGCSFDSHVAVVS